LLDLKYYSTCYMQSDERERFLLWYNEAKRSNYVFHFMKEIVSYCKNDVMILRRACLTFRKMFNKCGKFCPFEESTTIALACSRVYRKNFLQKNMIGFQIPGSVIVTLQLLLWILATISYTFSNVPLPASRQDGRLPEFSFFFILRLTSFALFLLFFVSSSFFLSSRLSSLSYSFRLISFVFSSRLSSQCRHLPYLLLGVLSVVASSSLLVTRRLFLVTSSSLLTTRRLFPRSVVYNIPTIRYVDVCSFYPYICKTGKFPVKHPTVYVGKECRELTGSSGVEIDKVEGLVYCTILPPRTLYHPVLPVRMHGKLMFALCRSCCENMYQSNCTHENTMEREFTGTWVADEIPKAVSIGQYNPETKEGGCFINTFLKIKQEASDWPSTCVDKELKIQYIDEYERTEGVKLDSIGKICVNPGLRVTTRNRLIQLLSSNEVDVTSILPVNDDVIEVCKVKDVTFNLANS
ncbi:hypothetical protein ALC57_01096, partial [Trachymyrmex cornetzi]